MKLKPKPKVAKNLSGRAQGAYRWDLGSIAFDKREESRGRNGTKMGRVKE